MAKKRMNGEGSWTQRDNGKWKLSVSYKGIGRKYFYGTKQECLDKKHKFEALLPSTIIGEKDILLKDFAQMWLINIKQPSLKLTSYDRLRDAVEKMIINKIGNLELKQIDDSLIQTMIINQLKTDGYSYSTIKKVSGALWQILEYATKQGKIAKNPMHNVTMPRRVLFETKAIKVLSEEDRNKLIGACYSTYSNGRRRYRFGSFYILLLYTGLRLGEGLALKWTDINFEKKTILVARTIVYVKNYDKNDGSKILIDQSTTKNGKNRIVHLSDMALNALYDLKEQSRYNPEGYIISTRNQTIMFPADAYKIFQRIIKKAGIEQYSVHALRHTFISMMIDGGVPISMVSQMVGHSSIDITMKVYAHLLQETQDESISIIKNLK